MKNTNKPQWLIDAENEIQKFEESKYGKMSDGKISSGSLGYLSQNRYNSEYQSKYGKIGGPLGAIASQKKLISELGEEGYKNHCKKFGLDMYSKIKDKQEWHKAGAKKSHELLKEKVLVLIDQIIAELPEYFTISETKDIMVKYGKNPVYFHDIKRFHRPDAFIIHEKGVKGHREAIYKKVV